jgi:hypothetical protein
MMVLILEMYGGIDGYVMRESENEFISKRMNERMFY